MIVGSWVDAIITIAVNNVLTPEVDLGRPWDTLLIAVPAIDSSQVTIQVAEKTGGTFQTLYVTDPADGGDNKVISALGTGGLTWVIPLGGFQFIKVATSAAQTANRTFRVCGVRA